MVTLCIFRDFLLFAGVSVQISAASSTFSVTDHQHVLLICCDSFSSMFLILNNIWKFKIKSPCLAISKQVSRITLIVLFQTKLPRITDVSVNFQFLIVIMRFLPVRKYQTFKLKSKVIDYWRYSVHQQLPLLPLF